MKADDVKGLAAVIVSAIDDAEHHNPAGHYEAARNALAVLSGTLVEEREDSRIAENEWADGQLAAEKRLTDAKKEVARLQDVASAAMRLFGVAIARIELPPEKADGPLVLIATCPGLDEEKIARLVGEWIERIPNEDHEEELLEIEANRDGWWKTGLSTSHLFNATDIDYEARTGGCRDCETLVQLWTNKFPHGTDDAASKPVDWKARAEVAERCATRLRAACEVVLAPNIGAPVLKPIEGALEQNAEEGL